MCPVYISHFLPASLQEMEISDTKFSQPGGGGGGNVLLLYNPPEPNLVNTEL